MIANLAGVAYALKDPGIMDELSGDVVLMAVVDSNYRFVYVDVGAYGKDCDSSVFQRADFYRRTFECTTASCYSRRK
jgi:hypothetical protein